MGPDENNVRKYQDLSKSECDHLQIEVGVEEGENDESHDESSDNEYEGVQRCKFLRFLDVVIDLLEWSFLKRLRLLPE